MDKRQKRLIKQIEGLRKQAEKHKEKLETKRGKKDTTHDYWKVEIEEDKRQADEKEEILEKLKGKRRLKKRIADTE